MRPRRPLQAGAVPPLHGLLLVRPGGHRPPHPGHVHQVRLPGAGDPGTQSPRGSHRRGCDARAPDLTPLLSVALTPVPAGARLPDVTRSWRCQRRHEGGEDRPFRQFCSCPYSCRLEFRKMALVSRLGWAPRMYHLSPQLLLSPELAKGTSHFTGTDCPGWLSVVQRCLSAEITTEKEREC